MVKIWRPEFALTKREQHIRDHTKWACRACALRDAGKRLAARSYARTARVMWALAAAQSRTDALMCEREVLAVLRAKGSLAAWREVQKWTA